MSTALSDPAPIAVTPGWLEGLRVLAFCDYYGAAALGGTEVVAHEVYRRMASWGARVTVLSASPTRARETELDGVHVVEHRTVDLSRALGAQVSVAPGLYGRALKTAGAGRPTVLHANNIFFQSSLAAARVQGKLGLPLVTTAHIAGVDALPLAVRAATRAYERTVGQFVLRRSCSVIAVSAAVEAHVRALGVRGPVPVVPNGVDHVAFHPAPAKERHRDAAPVVAFVGRLIANKGPEAAVEAIRRLRAEGTRVGAVFIGDGPLRARLESAVRDAGLAGDVGFTGQVNDVARRLREADILVRPSATEGMPLAVLEAMATGLCVVASDVPGNAELVDHDRNGLLFRFDDLDALVAQLRRVVLDHGLRRRLAAAGVASAAAHSWDRCAASTAATLQSAAARVP